MNVAIRIFSLATSSISLAYGASSVSLRYRLKREPTILETLCFSSCTAFPNIRVFFVRFSNLVMIFAIKSVYFISFGCVLAVFNSLLFLRNLTQGKENWERSRTKVPVKYQKWYDYAISKITSKYSGHQECIDNYVKERKNVLLKLVFLSLSGILTSMTFLAFLSYCNIRFIDCEKKSKSEAQKRTMNFSLTLLVASVLALLQEVCELYSIELTGTSFINWVFHLALKEQKKTAEENANPGSGNLIENVDLKDSERIQHSINESELNQDEEFNVVNVHSNENEEANELNEDNKMRAGDVVFWESEN